MLAFRALIAWDRRRRLTFADLLVDPTPPKARSIGSDSPTTKMSGIDWRQKRESCGKRGNKELRSHLQIASGWASELGHPLLRCVILGFCLR